MLLAKKWVMDSFLSLNSISSKLSILWHLATSLHLIYTTCEEYKGLQDVHAIGMESHNKHQRKYIKHVNNQELDHQDYYKNHFQ